MLKDGEWCQIVVDDWFPCAGDRPAFSSGNGSELWVLILEKALAKKFGSYGKVEAGLADNVMHDLTGAPSKSIDIDDEGLWESLVNAEAKDFIMAASAGTDDTSRSQLESLGLIAFHSYGLLSAKEITTEDGETVQLVKLRNPWGSFEWKGDWSDDSELWTDELKEEVGWTDADDGTFFMSLNDLRSYFNRVQVCNVNDDYVYSSIRLNTQASDWSVLIVNLTEDTE